MENVNAKTFRYTLSLGNFSIEQREFYEDNGYIIFRKLVDDETIDLCRQRFVDICHGKVDKGLMTLMKDISLRKTDAKGEYLYNKLQDILFDDVLSTYAFHPKILDVVENFCGPNILAMHSMLINKPPDIGTLTSRHPLHQDLHYFSFRPADRIVASWTAMESVFESNGALFILPGTHKGRLLPHDYPDWEGGVNGIFHGVKGYDDHPKIVLEMEKGDTVFFHPLLIHGSGPNLTQRFRKAISVHFSSSEGHYIDVKGTSQESVTREVLAAAKRRGVDMDIKDFWRLRSRLVRGKRHSL